MSTKTTQAKKKSRRGAFITLEGIEGSGKTTQLARLAKFLREKGYRVVETREPGGTPLAEQIRGVMLNLPPHMPSEHNTARLAEPFTPECEAALVFAARAQHVTHVINQALKQGTIVLCDRFSDSTLAYQGYARGLDVRTLKTLNRFATRGLTPDLTLLFDLPVESGLVRRQQHDSDQNRLDRETRQFHNRVRKGFLDLAAHEPHRIKVIDASEDLDGITAKVLPIVERLLAGRKGLRS
ncbi:MAG: dTMP kinase [Nitrospirales bacterium]|nr:dTMP kinase [Nitrospirales bacterium]